MKIKFKSSRLPDFYLIINKQLDHILNEQRAQRLDLAQLLRLANTKYSYYQVKPKENTLDDYETSPQTDTGEQ